MISSPDQDGAGPPRVGRQPVGAPPDTGQVGEEVPPAGLASEVTPRSLPKRSAPDQRKHAESAQRARRQHRCARKPHAVTTPLPTLSAGRRSATSRRSLNRIGLRTRRGASVRMRRPTRSSLRTTDRELRSRALAFTRTPISGLTETPVPPVEAPIVDPLPAPPAISTTAVAKTTTVLAWSLMYTGRPLIVTQRPTDAPSHSDGP